MANAELTLKKVLDRIAEEQQYINHNVQIKPISSGGANYTSVLMLAKISAPNKKDLQLFAKVAIMGENMRSSMPINLYEIERYAYAELVQGYEKLQDKYNVPSKDRLVLPKFYGYSADLYEETIVLEDLEAQGFTVYSRFESIDWPYASKAVETLAKFHALSIAYSQHCPDEYEKTMSTFNSDIAFDQNMDWLKSLSDKAVGVTKDEHVKERLQKYLDKIMTKESFLKFYGSSQDKKKSTLVHGDYRMSNLMHREQNGKLEIIPVDLQTIRVGSPILDLMYFIFTGSDQEFRARHFDELTDWYYRQMCRSLRALHVDPRKVYPKSDFDYELEEWRSYGMMASVFGLPIITVEEENAPSMSGDQDLSVFAKTKTSDMYSERMNGVINDYFRWGWI